MTNLTALNKKTGRKDHHTPDLSSGIYQDCPNCSRTYIYAHCTRGAFCPSQRLHQTHMHAREAWG